MDRAALVIGLLNNLYDMIDNAGGFLINSSKCVIDREEAKTILDQVRELFPREFEEAQRLNASRSNFIAHAKRQADEIRKTAEERARQLVDEQEVLRIATARSRELMAAATAEAAELRRSAVEFVDDKLRSSEEALAEALKQIRASRRAFDESTGAAPEPESPENDTEDQLPSL